MFLNVHRFHSGCIIEYLATKDDLHAIGGILAQLFNLLLDLGNLSIDGDGDEDGGTIHVNYMVIVNKNKSFHGGQYMHVNGHE